MGKISAAEIKDLKAAVKELEDLQIELDNSSGAAAWMKDVTTTTADFGPMLENTGTNVAQYVDARTNAISNGLATAKMGVTTAIGLLNNTITNFEINEKAHKDAADGTGNGGSGNGNSGPGRGKD